eukprot:1193815-Prorocentrum_minimum.AAC.1
MTTPLDAHACVLSQVRAETIIISSEDRQISLAPYDFTVSTLPGTAFPAISLGSVDDSADELGSLSFAVEVDSTALPVGNYSAEIVVRDMRDTDIVSEVVILLNIQVLERSKLLVFPPDDIQASGGGRSGGVIAGYQANPQTVWLINTAPDNQNNEYSVVARDGGGGMPPDWVVVWPESRGVLTNSRDVAVVWLNFTEPQTR